MSGKPVVGIIMGSVSDAETMREAAKILDEFYIGYEFRAMSAHRTPKQACEWAETASERGLKVLICAAGMAAHLAGVVAAHTRLPVLGVPMPGGALHGVDSLYSTVQMPKGTPVATFAVGKAGAANAALFALRIMAQGNPQLATRLEAYNEAQVQAVLAADRELQRQ